MDKVQDLFPQFELSDLVRHSRDVDILIGTDYFGLHPKQEIAKAGENLSIMTGELGGCLVGTHPLLESFEAETFTVDGLEVIEKSVH